MSEESVFEAARAIPDPAKRAAYLDRACENNPHLRREVEALLAAAAASNPLDRPPADLARTGAYQPEEDGPPAAAVGDRVGPYRLMEQIGEGGFGLVFVAEQTEPVRRKVALKVLKPGMDTRDVVARFEAERQALALMDHPNIARVFDAGSTPQGRPYFVMELVRGVPITEFCDANKLNPRARLTLFVQVCQAVQHAHQKGVIHRDIKPSNILVTSHDGVPVPKVIDFGVAKAVGQSLTEKTVYTRFAQMIGTPLYMSPEQAQMSGLDVDTRTDVYALGVLLYELLTGSTPFDRDRFKKAAYDEIRRIIREEEPPRPSTRLTSLGGTLTAVSASRGTEPGKLAGLVRGELDWIVMRCLEKDRNRRYDSAVGLAKDVQRYLAGDAVEACPPTLGYRLRKAYRRNRAGVLVGGAFAGLLITAAAVSSWLAVKASRAEAVADEKRVEAEANAKVAKENEELYAKEAGQNMSARIAAEITAASLQTDLDLTELRTDPRVGLLRLARPRKQNITNLDTPGYKVMMTAAFDNQGQPVPLPPGDILEIDNDHRDYKALRELSTLAVLAAGQDYAPLLPPITHDGQPVTFAWLSPDNQVLLTLGKDGTARLWETRTFRPLAVLRHGSERVMNCGFSPDGQTVFTDDQTSVARLWDMPTGRLRTATEARKNRYEALESPGVEVQLNLKQAKAGH